jgi:DNA-binding transcriptional LysR family regulator
MNNLIAASLPSMPTKSPIEPALLPTTHFDWTLMRSFLAVLDAGSLLGAARRLKQSQPTLGRHVSVLEAQLGCALFERTGRGLSPTAAARDIATYARQMQDAADALQRSLSRQSQHLAGTVRLTASQTVAAYLLPPLIAKLRKASPEIQIELVASNEVKNLLRREADIALRMVRPVQESLVTRKIATLALGTYAHVHYLRRHGTPRTPQDLLQHQLVGYDQETTIIDGFRAFGVGVTREHFAFRSDDNIVQWQAIRAGLGIGFASDYLAKRDRSVMRILPELAVPTLPVWLTTHREIHGNPRIRRVFDFLADNLHDQ